MRGLIKATQAAQTQQARADWRQLAEYAQAHGYSEQAERLQPKQDAGWRTIDRRINALMAAMGLTMPFHEWQQAQPQVR